MPCGGIFPAGGGEKAKCWLCSKPGCDHFVEEWDAYIHRECIREFLTTEEGRLVVEHKHHIQVGVAVLQYAGELTYMDPDKVLQELREAITTGALEHELEDKLVGDSRVSPSSVTMETIVEKFEALDTWLKRGGFLPTDWNKDR